MFYSKKYFLKTHNVAWNIQIAEICSVIFDVHAQFAFEAAHGNAFIFIFFLVQLSQWFKNWHILYQKLCALSVMLKLHLYLQILQKPNDYFEYYKMVSEWFQMLRNAIYAFTLICIKTNLSKINEWNFKHKSEISIYKLLQSFNEITWFFEKLQPQSGNFMNDPRIYHTLMKKSCLYLFW